MVPRDWPTRWQAAALECGDMDALAVFAKTGRMAALKASPIWQSLSDGAGGYRDTLGNPWPPFAFNSGMGVEEIDLDEAREMALLRPKETAIPAEIPVIPPVPEEIGETEDAFIFLLLDHILRGVVKLAAHGFALVR